jgi:hypothetical protein
LLPQVWLVATGRAIVAEGFGLAERREIDRSRPSSARSI